MRWKQQAKGSPGIGDSVLPFVTGSISAAAADIRPPKVGQPPVSTLIYADAAGCSSHLTAGINGLGRNSIVINTSLDAIVRLEDAAMTIDAAFVSLQDADFDISAFFDFLKDEYPNVRRIAFAQHESRYSATVPVHACLHDMILWDPWDRASFAEILKDALDCRILQTRSSWTDLQLFKSFGGFDRLAIAEIVKRYRHRIVHLVLDITRDTRDTEDIVQDVYLAIVKGLPYFGEGCSPGNWVDLITCKSIRSYFHCQPGRASPTIKRLLREPHLGSSL